MIARTTVILVDDHVVLLETLARWLEGEVGIAVVGKAGDADEALRQVVDRRPDVVVMDIEMPGSNVFEAARAMRARSPRTRVVFLSGHCRDSHVDQALASEASGFLTKGETPRNIARAIRAVAKGETYFSPAVAARIVIDGYGAGLVGGRQSRSASLTERERECWRHLARGLSKKEAAQALCLSERTVNSHTASLMAKLAVHNRVELSRLAIREGLIEA